MNDKIIKLDNGIEYAIIDQIAKDRKVYVFAVQVDNEQEMLTENYMVLEMQSDGSKITVDNINDEAKYKEINQMFIERLKNKA